MPTIFKDNPEYKEVFYSKIHDKLFYMPTNISNYHLSRQVAANAQNIFSSAGITKQLLESMLSKMLDIVNTEKDTKRIKSDIGTLCNNLLYRTKYPIDEECALRMGAIYTFMEGEDPNSYSLPFTQQKETLAKGDAIKGIGSDPDLYAFFLTMGMDVTTEYQNLSEDLKSMEYLESRQKTIQAMKL